MSVSREIMRPVFKFTWPGMAKLPTREFQTSIDLVYNLAEMFERFRAGCDFHADNTKLIRLGGELCHYFEQHFGVSSSRLLDDFFLDAKDYPNELIDWDQLVWSMAERVFNGRVGAAKVFVDAAVFAIPENLKCLPWSVEQLFQWWLEVEVGTEEAPDYLEGKAALQN